MHKNWIISQNALHKTFEFETFALAMAWMIKAVPLIDAMDHHPEWTNVYNKVKVVLTTHDAGNTITQKDHELAELLDSI